MKKAEVLKRMKDSRNILHRIKGEAKLNCLHLVYGPHSKTRKIEGNIERTGRRGRRRMRLLDERKRERRYCKLKDEARDHTVWDLALKGTMDLS